jgi:hypothetical protein
MASFYQDQCGCEGCSFLIARQFVATFYEIRLRHVFFFKKTPPRLRLFSKKKPFFWKKYSSTLCVWLSSFITVDTFIPALSEIIMAAHWRSLQLAPAELRLRVSLENGQVHNNSRPMCSSWSNPTNLFSYFSTTLSDSAFNGLRWARLISG